MLEKYGLYLLALGALCGLIGGIWLIIRAFRERALWGVALILFPPLGLLFVILHFRKSVGPVVVMALGGALIGTPYALSYYERHFVPLKPYEQLVDGELRVTLTGLENFDYSTLREKPQTAVLQMANADVDDRTLENLKGMEQLRELDLNGTQISDEGLVILAELPNLKTLRLARTKITDEGFQKHLASKESLMQLDLTGTEVKGKTKREWKKKKPDARECLE